MAVRRKHKNLPVYIVEDHSSALAHIYRNIGSGHLPFEGNLLVHFDSHPDLLIDKNLPAQAAFDKEKLLESLSIENWILPGCYSGQFSKVCWVKPSWSNQIPEGIHNISIGEVDGKIRVGTNLYYFMSDGIFTDNRKLSDRKNFELNVFEWQKSDNRSLVRGVVPYILDIDLDFFSTKNPFLEIFAKGDLYSSLQSLFSLRVGKLDNYDQCVVMTEKHAKKLLLLEQIFYHLNTEFSLENYPDDVPEDILSQLENVISIVDKHYDRFTFDWDVLYNAGMTCDEYPLPHHVSSSEEIKKVVRELKSLLEILPPPTIVTIARSSNDDYCPKEQVENIQDMVLTCMKSVYGDLHVINDYEKP